MLRRLFLASFIALPSLHAVAVTSTATVACQGTTPVDALIQSNVNSLSAAGGGTLYLSAGTCTLNNPVTLKSSVQIIGVQSNFVLGNPQFLGQQWTPSGGTIIQAGTATQGFIANATPLRSETTATWGANVISGIRLQYLTFSGFSGGGVVIGNTHNPGAQYSVFDSLAFYNDGAYSANGWASNRPAFQLENFSAINISKIYGSGNQGGAYFYLGTSSEQTGNSKCDTIIWDTFDVPTTGMPASLRGSPAVFARSFVMGDDPALVTVNQGHNEFKCDHVQVQGVQRSGFSDNAWIISGSTRVNVNHVEYFPVGALVFSNAGNNTYAANKIYAVLTNSGGTGAGTITLGTYRAAAAITASVTTTMTLINLGYPLVDLGGLSTPNVTDSNFDSLDVEGIYSTAVYGEGVGVRLSINQSSGGTNVTLRNNSNAVISSNQDACLTVDYDGTGDGVIYTGADICGPSNNQSSLGGGIFYSAYKGSSTFALDTRALSLTTYGGIIQGAGGGHGYPDLFAGGNKSFLRPATPIGIYTSSWSRGQVLNNGGLAGGYNGLEQTSAQTYSLLPILNSHNFDSYIGQDYRMFNVGTAPATITPSSVTAGQYFNDNSSISSITLAPGQWAFINAAFNVVTNRTYWAVISNGTFNGAAVADHLQLQQSTVANLPTCNAAAIGTLRAVTDAKSPTYNGLLTGGGTVNVPVYCNGSAWTAH